MSVSELSALTRLFSSAVFQEMAIRGYSELFARLLRLTPAQECDSKNTTVGDAFDRAFKILQIAGQRDEYIYRAAITKKILLGRHSLRTSVMLNEFKAGKCKADTAILNGTSTVYEIKSERDSLCRLENQIINYKKIFATVNVITAESHIENIIKSVPEDVGILCLSKRNQISTIRNGINDPTRICPLTTFDSLRFDEIKLILKSLDIPIPEVPNTKRYEVFRRLFSQIDSVTLHDEFVRTLKFTRTLTPLSELVKRLPVSLHAAALSVPVRRTDYSRLIKAIEMPLETAMTWA
ncbi:sce7726 family protein [Gluconobacter thailandicus]|uniref:sce7726 family protein n=1 Tax=Gluconobacter thailandicus TaxID=257438 RepID=UPI001E478F1A|nr:sce7726 family protein [Gluconobacter thailandicus]